MIFEIGKEIFYINDLCLRLGVMRKGSKNFIYASEIENEKIEDEEMIVDNEKISIQTIDKPEIEQELFNYLKLYKEVLEKYKKLATLL